MDLSDRHHHPGGLTVQLNKVHHVYTVSRVARMLGEDEARLWEIADEMDIEDGVIWVYGVDDDVGVMAFTDFGVETITELLAMHEVDRLAPPA
jgi:hypothetical protein